MKLFYLLLFAFPCIVNSQIRYFDPFFANVKVTKNVTYGENFSILTLLAGQLHPQRQKLGMDVYEPEDDNEMARPLVILLHGGFLLPPQVSGGCNGTRQDGEMVTLARRLAQRGFVVAVADYRLGWRPDLQTEIGRRFTYVNAIHRGVQDSRTCVRFFKKDQAESNQYRINPNKITMWGTEIGGVIALASATLDNMSDWNQVKFLMPDLSLMVVDTVNGNNDGTTLGIIPPGNSNFGFLPGDTLCVPNHIAYNSDFALAVNMAGALLDTTWMQKDDIPILSFAAPDALSNMECGMYYVDLGIMPIPIPLLGDVAGSCAIQSRQAQSGNNAVWENAGFSDALTAYSLSINGTEEGFYPFSSVTELAPWAFTISPIVAGTSCDTNSINAGRYIDTVLAYFAPRACAVLGLYTDCNITPLPIKDIASMDSPLTISPNPAVDKIRITAPGSVLGLALYDLQGKMVYQRDIPEAAEILVHRENWPSGTYFLKAYFKEGVGVSKVIWK